LHSLLSHLSLHDALPIYSDLAQDLLDFLLRVLDLDAERLEKVGAPALRARGAVAVLGHPHAARRDHDRGDRRDVERSQPVASGADRKSTRLNSSHGSISY